jgi:hypothetical protein
VVVAVVENFLPLVALVAEVVEDHLVLQRPQHNQGELTLAEAEVVRITPQVVEVQASLFLNTQIQEQLQLVLV